MSIIEHIHQQLESRKHTGALRSLTNLNGLHDFCSNDYLGLAQIKIPSTPGAGATGSRLISGNSALKEDVEAFLAQYYGTESALIFNSGYDANVGLFSSLGHRNSIFFYDELCHASIRDGIRLSLGKSFSFRHNNLTDLQRLLAKYPNGDAMIAIESVYSMDGDQADVSAILNLAAKYNAQVIVDEAHAVGIFGKYGIGIAPAAHPHLLAKVVTFGKALGFHGAAVLGSAHLSTYLINFARSFIYSTALPDHDFEEIRQRHVVMGQSNPLREDLFELSRIFKQHLPDWLALDKRYPGPVFPVIIGDATRCKRMEKLLSEAGFAVKAILSPTVPPGSERLRVTLHVFNTPKSVLSLIEHLHAAWNASL